MSKRNFDKEAAGQELGPPLVVRGVLFSPAKGVYLGDGKWSYADPGWATAAPTHARGEVDPTQVGTDDATFRECYPDREGNLASRDQVAAAGMPRW